MATGDDRDKVPPPQLDSFLAIELDQRTAENALANRKVTANLAAVMRRYSPLTSIKNLAQLDAALSFISSVGPDSLDIPKFEETCGVGVIVSIEEIQSTVTDILKENMEAIVEQRYHINVGSLCGQVRKRHPWGDAKLIKEEIEKKACRDSRSKDRG